MSMMVGPSLPAVNGSNKLTSLIAKHPIEYFYFLVKFNATFAADVDSIIEISKVDLFHLEIQQFSQYSKGTETVPALIGWLTKSGEKSFAV